MTLERPEASAAGGVGGRRRRRPEASAAELEAYPGKAQAVADTHGTDLETDTDALMIASAAAQARLFTPPAIRNTAGDDEASRLKRHRVAVVTLIEALAQPPMPPE
ncbi:hypothetical protein [Streptomyces sp. NPDC047841]|uniref:hypothetical protein n=1 Tax=Streptomyces sp. NPDC047841 TaxID=3154708 RepID=UPI0034552F9D